MCVSGELEIFYVSVRLRGVRNISRKRASQGVEIFHVSVRIRGLEIFHVSVRIRGLEIFAYVLNTLFRIQWVIPGGIIKHFTLENILDKFQNIQYLEPVTQRCFMKRSYKFLGTLQESTCAWVSFWIKLQISILKLIKLKKRLWHRCFPVYILKLPKRFISSNTYEECVSLFRV